MRIALSSRAAYGHLVELDCWHANADRDALPVFAAGSDAFIHLEVVADHGDVLQRLRPVADQRGIANRGGDFAVLDQVSLRRREDKLSVGDVDLAAAEVDRVEAALDAA